MIAIFFTSSAVYDILILEFFYLELSGMIQLIIETNLSILGSLNWVLLNPPIDKKVTEKSSFSKNI